VNGHERIEELVAVRALGGLETSDAEQLDRAMAEHGPDCAECRRLETEYDEVAGRLAFALDPVAVPPGFQDRVVAAATRDRASSRAAEVAPPATRRTGLGRLRPLVAIAASLVLFAGGWAVGSLAGGDGAPTATRVVAFQGEDGDLSVAYRPGERGIYLLGSDLEQPPEGSVYEVWLIQGETPVAGPCLTPAPDGSLFAFVDAEMGSTHTMAVTVEPETCSTAPTTEPILTAQITA
jgi:Anti-sigma-K factor rskA